MKELKCHQCSCYLGEIERGKLKKGSVVICNKCFEAYKILEDLENYKKGTNTAVDMDAFKDLFGMK